ncbi:MAG: sulfate ABC transporter ATP-binding protein, partial [Kurthia sp.]|nr:sulfate ABC transporter ATP-binding protein [Kurthia sp.]
MSIELREIDKHFGQYHALQKISLSIQPGELVALLGPSGSGKTSLLRIIAGLETLDEGTILFDQKEVVHLSAKERNIGFVFQHYALFNHMTVFDNVAYGLKVRPKKLRPSKKEIEDKVIELLSLVKLEHFAKRYPSQLSGGQRQRVALARALAVEPKVLLLDEPFGALDAKVRKDLRRWLRKLHNDYHITSIFVTHDQEEALDVADRIVIMNEGRIEQIGSPVEVYENPASPFVYDFLGNVNLFKGRLRKGELINGDFSFKVPGSNLDSEQETVG